MVRVHDMHANDPGAGGRVKV
eukprot:COSAG06_NODE_66222_length_255_cov_0.506410_1_plen_20_part_01